jgi:putative restriction endonuclease
MGFSERMLERDSSSSHFDDWTREIMGTTWKSSLPSRFTPLSLTPRFNEVGSAHRKLFPLPSDFENSYTKAALMKIAEAAPVQGAELWPLSVEGYHALGEAGLMPERTELLYGLVYHKRSKSPLHSYLVQLLQELFLEQMPRGYALRVEQPLTLADSEPEPDLAVVQGRPADFRLEHPNTADLVVEVCVTTIDFDRSKLPAYAKAGVKECWLVLGMEKQIEVYSELSGDRFSHRTFFGPGGKLKSLTIPEVAIDLGRLFS